MHLQIVDVPCAMLVCQRVMDKKTATRLHLETSHPMVMCCFFVSKDSCQTSPVLCTPKVWKPGFSHKKFSAAQAISIIVKQHQHVNFANLPRNGCLHQNKCFERLLGLVTGDHGLNLSPRHPTVSERKIWSDERNHPKPVSLILWNLFSSQLFKKDERTSPKKHFQTKCLSKRRETQNDQNVFKLELSTFLQQKSHLFFSHRFLLHPENQHLLNTKKHHLGEIQHGLVRNTPCRQLVASDSQGRCLRVKGWSVPSWNTTEIGWFKRLFHQKMVVDCFLKPVKFHIGNLQWILES